MREEKTKFETLDNDFLMNDVNNLLLWLWALLFTSVAEDFCMIIKQKEEVITISTKGILRTFKSCIMCCLRLNF